MPATLTREPMISVVVPAYNRGATIEASLDSLLAQTYRDWEAIVVDDGSVDDTAAVVEGYAARDARIRLHRQPNGGVSRARNAGIALVRTPWTFFLDADDWIDPRAFARLVVAAASDPGADAVYGGYVRVDEAGRELRVPLPEPAPDLFPVFARTCAISVHACLVKTQLVRRAGGFDESLVTCEDWDLWQRIARLGARFAAIPDHFAYYRMRVGSASGSGRRMLADGLLVIDRGHGQDPRLANGAAPPPESPARSGRDLARTYFACYAAGLEIAAGSDACDMIDALGGAISPDVDPRGIAETLFLSVAVGRAADPGEWVGFPPAMRALCERFVAALGRRLGDDWLPHAALDALERFVLGAAAVERPCTIGRWHLMELELDGAPPEDLELPAGAERILCSVRCGGEPLDEVELAVVDGWMPARALADALVARDAWELLRAFFERHVYPALTLDAADGRARIERDGRLLFDGPLDPGRTRAQAVHDAIGWTVFLQELWGEPSWAADDFYVGARRAGAEASARRLLRGERVALDLADPLPRLRARGAERILVDVSVAGVPLSTVACEAPRGVVSSHRLRQEILVHTGFELCHAVVREAVVLAPAAAGGSLRERLAATRAARGASPVVPADVTVIGRAEGADGTSASRWIPLPAAAARERLVLAHREGEPTTGPEGDDVERLLSAPLELAGRRERRRLSDASLLRSIPFERIFGARADPWDYGSDYEEVKYGQTLALLPERPPWALELGCAEGAFTRRLAERVGQLTAADLSAQALARASRRCAELNNVAFAQLDAFEGSLGGPYDLIVCSELLYYAESRAALDRAARRLVGALAPDGQLVTAHAHVLADDEHAPGFDWDVPFGAATIERALLATRMLDLVREIRTPHYRVQRYARRRVRRRPWRAGRHAERTPGASGELAPAAAERFRAGGGPVRREPATEPPTTTRLPILMYHRVAPDGAEASRRWRLHPDDFEAQLHHLREQGYVTLTFEQWRAASDRRQPIPARSAMLTFDDGYADFTEHALPLLERYGFHATMFVVTDLVGAANAWDEALGERLELMDWPTLAAVRRRGIEIESHSALHRRLPMLPAAELVRDLCRSRERLYDELGVTSRAVCYPFGSHDRAVLALAGACGFRYGVTTNGWHASFGDEPLGLPRLEVHGTETLDDFVAKLRA